MQCACARTCVCQKQIQYGLTCMFLIHTILGPMKPTRPRVARRCRTLGSRSASGLTQAMRIWQWLKASGMINNENLVNDGLSSSNCKNNMGTTWTYVNFLSCLIFVFYFLFTFFCESYYNTHNNSDSDQNMGTGNNVDVCELCPLFI